MKLEKAMEILEKWYAGGYATRIEDMNPAVQLGIKALVAWRQYRNKKAPCSRYLLLGETEE